MDWREDRLIQEFLCSCKKRRQIPDKIYKYISFTKDAELNLKKLELLYTNKVFMSIPENYNDPYDSQICVDLNICYNDFLKIGLNREKRRLLKKAKSKNKELQEEYSLLQCNLKNEWASFRKHIFIACFTERWDDFLMWAHYANSYSGICVEYEASDVIQMGEIVPVNYTDSFFDINKYITRELLSKSDNHCLYAAGIEGIISKSSCWSYENEWRLLDIIEKENDFEIKDFCSPKAIFFGHKLDEKVRNEILKNVKADIFYDICLAKDNYKLERM